MFPGSGLTFTLVDSDFIYSPMTIMGAIGIADTVDAITGDLLMRSLLVMSFCGGSYLVEEQDYVPLIVLTTRLKFPTANASQRLGTGEEGATVEKNLQEIDQTEAIVPKKSIALTNSTVSTVPDREEIERAPAFRGVLLPATEGRSDSFDVMSGNQSAC